MHTLKILLLAGVMLPALSNAQAPDKKGGKAPPPLPGYTRTIISPGIDGLMDKVLYYAADKPGKNPLLIFLHGAGGHKADITKLRSPFAEGCSRNALVCDVIRPQSQKGWSAQSVDQLLDYMIANYEIDENRIYVAGYSMGGAGTWTYAFEGSHDIAAFVPIASGASRTGKIHEKWDIERVKDKPVWMFHGDQDTVVPYANAKESADLISAINPKFKFTVFEGVGHKSFSLPFRNEELYTWVLAQSLNGKK